MNRFDKNDGPIEIKGYKPDNFYELVTSFNQILVLLLRSMKADQDIIGDILSSGSPDSYGQLVNKYQKSVFTICFRILKNREDAEEVSQDVFIKSFKNLNNLQDQSKFKSWMMRIAYTLSIDRVRLKRLKSEELDETKKQEVIAEGTPYSLLESAERRDLLRSAIHRLDKDQSIVVSLFYIEDLAIKEIMQITGFSKSNVKVLLFRGRSMLKQLIDDQLKKEILGQ